MYEGRDIDVVARFEIKLKANNSGNYHRKFQFTAALT